MRVAVTGGSGFVGSNLVDRLATDGHDVVVVDTVRPHRSDVAHRHVDIRDLDALTAALRGCDVVFHLAAVSNVNDVAADPVTALDVNVTGTARVWEAARRNEVGRAVLASTVWVYAAAPPGDEPVDEQTPLLPGGSGHIYTGSKIAAEMVAHNSFDLYGQPFTILRYGIPYGPRMRPQLVIPRFVEMARNGQKITVHGDGSQYRNYIYVDDLIEGHLRALGEQGENQVFNLEGREPVSIRQLVQQIQGLLERPVAVEFGPGRPGDYAGREVSNAKAERLLGWTPRVSFEDGMRQYLEWFLEADEAAGAVNER